MKSILLTLLIFAAIIIIHECGHFFAARLCGVRVNEFAIGMGPTLLRFGKKETRYSWRLFPIGGFVAMEGESDQSDDPRAFCNQAVWKRIIIVCAGAIMNLVLGFIIILALTIPNKTLASTTIAEFSEGASTLASGLQVGDQILKINDRTMWVDSDIIFALSTDADGVVDMVVRRDGEKVTLNNVQFTIDGGTLVIDFKVVGLQRGLVNTLGYSLGENGVDWPSDLDFHRTAGHRSGGDFRPVGTDRYCTGSRRSNQSRYVNRHEPVCLYHRQRRHLQPSADTGTGWRTAGISAV